MTLLLATAGGCRAGPTAAIGPPDGVTYTGFHRIAPGLDLARGHARDAFGLDGAVARPQDLTVLRVDVTTPGLRFTTAPLGGPDAPPRPGHQVVTTGTSVSGALRSRPELAAAINANFFWPCCEPGSHTGVGMSLFGLAIDDGQVVSDPRAPQEKPTDTCATGVPTPAVPAADSTGATALLIDRANRPALVPASADDAPIDPAGVQAAVAGGPQPLVAPATRCGQGDQYPPLGHVPGPPELLAAGRTTATPSADPPEVVAGRTFVGVSGDRRYLYLATIDGSESSGAAFFDEASWLLIMGASDGLNLDGGGSSTMAVDEAHLDAGADLGDPPCAGSGVRLLNDPHGVAVGDTVPACSERLVGDYLGVVVPGR